jgi:transposase
MFQDSRHRIVPREYAIFGGLDVDKKRMAVTFGDHGQLLQSLQMPYSSSHLINYLDKHFAGCKIALAYEVGPTGFGLYDDLTAAGYRCLVVAPSMVPTAPGKRVKTNRIDSRKLCLSLRGGQLQSIHIPSDVYRELRHLVQLRDSHVGQLKASKQRIKSLLLYEGIPFPEAPRSCQWSARVLRELATLPCNASVRFKLDSLLTTLTFHNQQAVAAHKQMRLLCQKDPELTQSISYLLTVPGLGWITASHLVARIGDWRQLGNVRQIAGFLGLVSSEHSTGDKIDRGSITRSGDSRLRNKLIQAAWTAIRKDPELREFYRRIFLRHPPKLASRKAIVAVARKLTTRIYSVLKEQRPFEPRPQPHSAPLTAEETIGPRERLDAVQSAQD